MRRRPGRCTLFPYTTLFRSLRVLSEQEAASIRDELKRKLQDAQRSEEHTSELQSRVDLVCRLLLEKTNTLCDPLLKPKRSDRNRKLAHDQDRLIQIQLPSSPGRLPASRCI